MILSTAVSLDRVSRVVGYKVKKGFFQTSTPNLPQRIAIFGEANTANQATLDENPREITSAQEAGDLYGYGSPIHQIMRILRPLSGDGVGGIPTIVYPQKSNVAATATVIGIDVTIAAAALASTTHYIVLNGRFGIDGEQYAFSVVKGDTELQVLTKMRDAINNVLSAPCIASLDVSTPGSEFLVLTSKWEGQSSGELNYSIYTGTETAGVTYSTKSTVVGTGVVSIADALDAFGNAWNTIVINPYNTTTVLDALEAFNGIPDPEAPTGRYSGIVFKPFIAITGSVDEDKDVLAAITDSRSTQVTNAIAPAPNSYGFSWEAAANMGYLHAVIAQNSPHLDVNGKSYPDMPVPLDEIIADMADYNNRDFLVKKGCSTVTLNAGAYQVQDFVTTYHPTGEVPPQYRYCRNLQLDFNVRYGYYILEQINVVDNAIAPSTQVIGVASTIKPAQWKQVLNSFAEDLGSRALIADVDFMKNSIEVQVSDTNPDRLETKFRYKRTGIARISSTDAEAGFAFGVR